MNERANALHLSETQVATVHGLPPSSGEPGDLTSAYDLAVLARALVKYPEIFSVGVHPRRAHPGGDIHPHQYQQAGLHVPGRRWPQDRLSSWGWLQRHRHGAAPWRAVDRRGHGSPH